MKSKIKRRVEKMNQMLNKKRTFSEVIEMPQGIIDFLEINKDLDILSIFHEVNRKAHDSDLHPEVLSYLRNNRENQVDFAKAWTGEYKLEPREYRYAVKNKDIGRYVKYFELSKGGQAREFSMESVPLFVEKEEAEIFANVLRILDDEEYEIVTV